MSSINPVSSQYSNVTQSQQTDQTSTVKKHHHHLKSQQASDTQSSSSSSSPKDILDLGSQNNSQPITYSKPVNQA
ncbi:hypothetical protein [Desulfosporosinus sp. SB140]|uniref:hypothetical protein n=1 Tax=Desulfosporosinus paludis TaxID=3115649 RepID=UPI00388FB67B